MGFLKDMYLTVLLRVFFRRKFTWRRDNNNRLLTQKKKNPRPLYERHIFYGLVEDRIKNCV